MSFMALLLRVNFVKDDGLEGHNYFFIKLLQQPNNILNTNTFLLR